MTLPGQGSLLCGCGRAGIFARGRCGSCYFAWRRSERLFGGLRLRVLERDGYLCRACGRATRTVHHRRPGENTLRLFAAICLVCHARLHHLHRLHYGLPPFLAILWREQHRGQAEQLELGLDPHAAAPEGEIHQPTLFEAA